LKTGGIFLPISINFRGTASLPSASIYRKNTMRPGVFPQYDLELIGCPESYDSRIKSLFESESGS
jgi:hypothetical protein